MRRARRAPTRMVIEASPKERTAGAFANSGRRRWTDPVGVFPILVCDIPFDGQSSTYASGVRPSPQSRLRKNDPGRGVVR